MKFSHKSCNSVKSENPLRNSERAHCSGPRRVPVWWRDAVSLYLVTAVSLFRDISTGTLVQPKLGRAAILFASFMRTSHSPSVRRLRGSQVILEMNSLSFVARSS